MDADRATGSTPPGPLHGHRVIDLTGEEGQFCGRMLAGLGADVIKVEPPDGDAVRRLGPWYHDVRSPETSLRWFALNAGKRSVTLDLGSASGKDQLLQLVATADVVLESYAPGHLEAVGLGFDRMRAAQPGIVLTSITGFGQDGPYRDVPWTDITAVAMSGLMNMSGDEDRAPLRMSVPQAFFHASMQATIGTLISLYSRGSGGGAQHVDVSAQESLMMSLEGPGPVMNVWLMGGYEQQRRGRSREPSPGMRVPTVLPCRDGFIAIASILGQSFSAWLAALDEDGMADDLHDPRWMTAAFAGTVQPGQWVPSADDLQHVFDVVSAWTRSHSKAEIAEAARRHQLLAGPQNNVLEILENEQLKARGFFVEVDHPELNGSITYPGAPFRMTRTPWRPEPRPPLLGEHTDDVLAEIDIDALSWAGGEAE